MAPRVETADIHVLLVDGDPAYARTVESDLRASTDAAFTVTWKGTVQEALDVLGAPEGFDIIVTEYRFPASNGLEFCLELNTRDIHLPIVFLTADKDFALAVEAMKIGVEDFLVKDELRGTSLGRSLANVHERVQTRKGMEGVAKRLKMAESKVAAVKELVVTVCHEFNNPLASVKISVDLLKRMMPDREDKRLLESFEESFTSVEREIIRLRDTNFERIDPHLEALKEERRKR